MLLFYRFQVLEDGCLIDNDNGRIMQPLTRSKGKDVPPFHLIKDDNNKTKYFSVKYLMEKLGEEYYEEEIDLPEDYSPVKVLEVKEGQKMSDVVFQDIIGDL